MFKHFRKCSIYSLSRDVTITAEVLAKALEPLSFTPCGSQDMAKTGFVSPWGSTSDQLVMSGQGFHMLAIKTEKKILPSPVLKQALETKISKLEADQGRKLKKSEKDSLKDEVLHTLLPRAFSRYSTSFLFIDTEQKRIYTAAGAKGSEDMLALLRKALGSLPVVPLTLENPIELTLTEWVRSGKAPQGFTLSDTAELKAILEDGGTIRAKKQELVSDEITCHIEAGKLVTSLDLSWEDRIDFSLNDVGQLSRIKFADALCEQNDDIDREDVAQRMNADFILLTGELSSLVASLILSLGGEAAR